MPGEALTIREALGAEFVLGLQKPDTTDFSWTFMVWSVRWGRHLIIPVDLICVK
jgi:hypothetical protein